MTQRVSFPQLTQLGGVADPTLPQDAVNKQTLDAVVVDVGVFVDEPPFLIGPTNSSTPVGSTSVFITGNVTTLVTIGEYFYFAGSMLAHSIGMTSYNALGNVTTIGFTPATEGTFPAGINLSVYPNVRTEVSDLIPGANVGLAITNLPSGRTGVTISSSGNVNSVTGQNGVVVSPTAGNVVVSGVNATASTVGVVRPDNTSIVVNSGVLSAVNTNQSIAVITFPATVVSGANQTFTNAALANYTSADYISVSVDGSVLNRTNYLLSGSTLTIVANLLQGAIVQVQPSNAGGGGGGGGGVLSFGTAANPRTGAITVAGSPSVTITESPNNTFTFSSSGGGGGSNIQVDGIVVTPTADAINLADSTAANNRIVVSNPAGTNVVNFNVDGSSPIQTPSVRFNALSAANGVTLNTGATTVNYALRLPLVAPAASQFMISDNIGNLSWAPIVTPTFTGSAVWTSTGTNTKAAYNSDGSVNISGMTVTILASVSIQGNGWSNSFVTIQGQLLSGTYNTTNPSNAVYVLTIPASAFTAASPGQTNSTVDFDIQGIFINRFSIAQLNDILNNTQPGLFTTTLTATYATPSVPFYTTTAAINYSYTNTTGTITSFAGTITLASGGGTLAASSASGSFADQPLLGGTIGGSATGTGGPGSGSRTVNLAGTLAPATIYTPAFYAQTANNTPPTFTTASTQTAGAAQGATVNYPLATASTQYDWICTQRPLANIMVVTPFGNSPLVPDVTAPTQTISGQVFNVYGFTRLSTSVAVQLVIS